MRKIKLFGVWSLRVLHKFVLESETETRNIYCLYRAISQIYNAKIRVQTKILINEMISKIYECIVEKKY